MITDQADPIMDTGFDPSCKACTEIAKSASDPMLVWQDDLWVLRHNSKPYAALGWMTLHTKRHAPNVTYFTEAELADFGPILQKISRALIAATGALRVYIGSLSEATPHFHAHLVPRYEGGPKGWDAFGDLERARQGLTSVDDAEVTRVVAAVGKALA